MTPEEKGNLLKEYVKRGKSMVGLDFRRADLIGLNTPGASLARVNLARANLTDATLVGADLSGADLSEAHLAEAALSRVKLIGANLSGANLFEANLSGADFTAASLFRAKLINADLEGVKLVRVNLAGTVLFGANLAGADLTGADLAEATFSQADLTEAKLTGANSFDADFTEAKLTRADLTGADLKLAKLTGAHLPGAVLVGAKLTNTRVNLDTVRRSNLDANTLRDWKSRGARFVDLQDWPPDLRHAVTGDHQGLTLYIRGTVNFDEDILLRHILRGANPRATVEIAETLRFEDRTLIRLTGGSDEELTEVAEAIARYIDEELEQKRSEAELEAALERQDEELALLVEMNERMRVAKMKGPIDELLGRVVKMVQESMYRPSDDVIEMQEDKAKAHLLTKDRALMATGEQRLVRWVARGAGKQIVGDAVSGEVGDALREIVEDVGD
ncbi:MAG: pentapeptide repeat-containing protein [Alphaproteobacteria bacterium]|nr:pentapeptide repeat-containing protein [Alphaproteobacteria bacterium]